MNQTNAGEMSKLFNELAKVGNVAKFLLALYSKTNLTNRYFLDEILYLLLSYVHADGQCVGDRSFCREQRDQLQQEIQLVSTHHQVPFWFALLYNKIIISFKRQLVINK